MKELLEIEKTLQNEFKASIWDKFIKSIDEYELIKPNDHVCVCISGGKDSMILAKLFQEYMKITTTDFKITYLVMNPGYNKVNLDLIMSNLEKLQIPAKVVETNIFEIANLQDHSPCYLCAKMRRGALYKFAEQLGCNKIALGHHYDDVIETILMNMLNTGSFQTMLPKLHSTNYQGMEVIRPLYYVREKDVIAWKDYNELTFIRCACRFTENTANEHAANSLTSSQRFNTKKLIEKLKEENPNIEDSLFNSTKNINLDSILGYKTHGEFHSFMDEYETKKDEE